MRKFKGISAVCALVFSLGAFAASEGSTYKVGLVLDKGGRDDKSFNAAAYLGATQAQRDLGFTLKAVEATDDNAYEPMMRSLAQKKFDLVIAIGVGQQEAMKKVAEKFPETKFAIVDAEVNLPNVRSLLFQEHEGSYLVGALAALTSKTGKIGFIGGMDIPLIRRFEMGYKAGAEKINPKVQLISNYVGLTAEAWNNPAKGKELAVAQYSAGADVIFAAAGASGAGLYDAAEEKKKLAIGVDSNQNWIKPGYILTSMLKRVDTAVKQAITDGVQKKFTAGSQRFGLSNQGIDYAMDQFNAKLVTPAAKARVDALKADIIAGKIKVPDYYQKK